ncbi:amidase [Noviherbaspirillum saxi]|uniref:Amidase n=1 Tax=Noviherbaspirillum saxi TaxID=2320863 RepID=A0A3A3FWC7_9BURK|nr:amidase [Noviherbaspirillum saxi]RJG00034.1 amidase [Noviherbaspirillum saxi]
MTKDLHFLEINEISRLVAAREISSVELTEHVLRRIERLDPRLKSYALTTPELALAQAKEADRMIGRGQILSPLHGVPVAVKDLCFTKGVTTTAGLRVHRDFAPQFDATVVRKLRESGAVLLGKLQLTEGAYSDCDPATAPVNPWNADYWPGGSSNGSGVATAAGLCFGSLGSDTGGSIRFPSAANGTTGLKPTWGRVSRHGCFELAASLDHFGPICRSANDAAIMLAAIAGTDADDPTTLRAQVPNYQAGDDRDLRGFRVGFDEAYALGAADPEIRQAVQESLRVMASLGATIVPMVFPDMKTTIADWGATLAVEAAVAHAATYPSQRAGYGPALAGLIDAGNAMSGTNYQQVLLRRRAFTGRVNAGLEPVDVMLIPAQPIATPTLATHAKMTRAEFAAIVRYTAPFNMSGHPTLTLPVGFTAKGLPVAVQFVGKHLGEADICRAGRAFQRATDWHRRHPQV